MYISQKNAATNEETTTGDLMKAPTNLRTERKEKDERLEALEERVDLLEKRATTEVPDIDLIGKTERDLNDLEERVNALEERITLYHEWGQWRRWSSCECGLQSRSRQCPAGGQCEGEEQQSQTCPSPCIGKN